MIKLKLFLYKLYYFLFKGCRFDIDNFRRADTFDIDFCVSNDIKPYYFEVKYISYKQNEHFCYLKEVSKIQFDYIKEKHKFFCGDYENIYYKEFCRNYFVKKRR